MRDVTYLLIGGGLVCHNAAAAIRRRDAGGSVLMVSDEPHRPYNRPPLTKAFMRGDEPLEKAFIASTDWYTEHRVSFRPGTAVTAVHPREHLATLDDGEVVRYEKALLGTGGRPVEPALPGDDLPGVHCLRTMDEAARISRAAQWSRRAVILGGGFIGVEMAAALTRRGLAVTLVHPGERIYSRFAGPTLAEFVTARCREQGVEFVANQKAVAFHGGEGQVRGVELEDGRRLPCELAVAAMGIVPNVELARHAGLEVGDGVVVNERLQTSASDIYAGGDIANVFDPYSRRRRRIEHWGQADYTGTLAGQNMAGADNRYALLPYLWTDVFDMHIEFAGDEHAPADATILRGQTATGQFALLHLHAHHVAACYSVNLKRAENQSLQRLIEHRVNVQGYESHLADTTFDAATLLPPAKAA
ncbi:MAG: FAD-dependent oxidoreductase [Phycisphaerae bacterium]|nr:FAD-dependent oxidoreductase [Phycisphaerae bacterium]